MKKYFFHISRNLLQDDREDTLRATGSPSITYNPPDLHNSSFKKPFDEFNPPNSSTNPFDSSIAFTILVLLTALFFMAFFSLYIRRFADNNSTTTSTSPPSSHHNHPPQPPRSVNSKGLDPSAVRSLSLIPYSGDAKHPNDCSICLTEFEEREMVKIIPYCRHGFHPQCIDAWLSTHVSCPLCRSTQLFPAADEVRLGVFDEDGNDGVSERSTVDNF